MNGELAARLVAAEKVCTLVGITAARDDSDRGKALTQAWMDWHREYGFDTPRVSDDEIRKLAERRDHKRTETMKRHFGDHGGSNNSE